MHGIIFMELQKFVTATLGANQWKALLKEAGLGSRIYMPVQVYPDAEVVSLVTTASSLTGVPASALLEGFGKFIAPDLVKMYRFLIKPDWKTLDLIENAEKTIHTVVRLKDPQAEPPELRCARPSAIEVVIGYSSPRHLCAVAKGIALGVAEHFGEKILLDETSCMNRGDATCQIVVRLTSAQSATGSQTQGRPGLAKSGSSDRG